jgi:hypothetical protein
LVSDLAELQTSLALRPGGCARLRVATILFRCTLAFSGSCLAGCALHVETSVPCEHASDRQRCLDGHYFGVDVTPDIRPCAADAADEDVPALDLSLQVALFYSDALSDSAVVEASRRLQASYRHFGIRLSTLGPAAPASLAYAMSGSASTIDAALGRAAIPPDRELTDDEARRAHRAVADVIFAELRAFVAEHAQGKQPAVNLLLVEHIVEPGLSKYLFGSSDSGILGFGLSPTMLARLEPNDPAFELQTLTGLPDGFTPVALIGQDDVAALDIDGDNIVAHELGHALGLTHSMDPDNLMYIAPKVGCRPFLTSEQLAQLANEFRDR